MQPNSRGFTLVELLAGVALLVVLIVLAIPSFRDLIFNNLQSARVNELAVALNLARSEAVRRGKDTILCITDGGSPPDCDTGTAWEAGWILFSDDNGNNAYDNASEDLIQVHEALEDMTLLGSGPRIGFNPRGSTGNAQTLVLCDPRGHTEARGLIISPSGRTREAVDGDGDGIREDGAGNDFTAADCP
jgi:type IV fimbrial biogenesis protein FimT